MKPEQDLIAKPRQSGSYYLWQLEAYGESHYYGDLPCEIFSSRPMPCTPSGDLVGAVPTAREGLEILRRIEGLQLEAAREYVKSATNHT